MILGDFLRKLALDGLEYFGKFYSTYYGFVISNEDPDKLGRILVDVPEVFGQDHDPIWALPKGVYAGKGYGINLLPQEGSMVTIEFRHGNPQFPLWDFSNFKLGESPEDFGVEALKGLITPGGITVYLDDRDPSILLKTQDDYFIRLGKDTFEIKHKDGISYTISKNDIKVGKGDMQNLLKGQDTINHLKSLIISLVAWSSVINSQLGIPVVGTSEGDPGLSQWVAKLNSLLTKYS